MKRNHTPKVAIITRTKNRNLLLERAVKSVLAQTSKNYVHVVLNDGGDKRSLNKLLQNYPDENRVVIHNDKSVGLTKALNQAIRAVDTEYISILDDDDSWHELKVEKTNDYLNRTHAPGVVVFMDRIIEKIEGEEVVEISRNRWHESVDTVNLYKQCLDNYLSNGSFNYRRTLYEELGGYDESLSVAEDWDFGIRCLLSYDINFLPTDDALVYYHHRPDQTGDSGNSVFAGIDTHRQNLNQLRNKYLREDINAGRFGVGYLMNTLAYTREREEILEQKNLEKVIRLEGHINYQSREVQKSVEHVSYKIIHSRIISKLSQKLGVK